jgi:ABC-2 type transport system ATP-binding protein
MYACSVLSVRSLKKTFKLGTWPRARQAIEVLDGIDFNVAAGEIVGLLGANGAGKTTVLHAIAGLLRPDKGWIGFNGTSLDASQARSVVGLCSSADRSFYYRLTLRENLVFFGRLYGLRGDALSRRVAELFDLTDLSGVAGRQYSRCSTGMRQRLGVARALLHDPPVLLLDEPTRAIDPLHAQKLRTFIRADLAARSRKAIVLATNSLEEAWTVCDRIVVLAGGRCIATDTPVALQQRFAKGAEDLFAPAVSQ